MVQGRKPDTPYCIDELSRSPRPPTNLSPPWIVPGTRVDQNFDRSYSRAERRQDSQLDGPGVQVHPLACSMLATNVVCSVLQPRLLIIHIPVMKGVPDLVLRLLIIYHHLQVNIIHKYILNTTLVLLLRRINDPRPTINVPRQGLIRIQT